MTSFYQGFRKEIMKNKYLKVDNLEVSIELSKFVNEELLTGTNISPEKFWSGLDKSVHELAPKNEELLKKRNDLQKN